MEFRLTYSGNLFSTGNDSRMKGDKRADHKHAIRLAFHPQLKRLWDVTPFLKSGGGTGPTALLLSGDASGRGRVSCNPNYLSKKHADYGWGFIPLVTSDLNLLCSIDVLLLRPQQPGGVVNHGDIDGRLKTLLDALAKPDSNQSYEERSHTRETNPMYVLLEDDNLITKVSVETDQMLESATSKYDKNEVRLVITVRLRPYELHLGNMQFG